jgi:hypothetical protein
MTTPRADAGPTYTGPDHEPLPPAEDRRPVTLFLGHAGSSRLDVDRMRDQAPAVRRHLIHSLRASAAALRTGRGTVIAAEDTYDLVRRTTAAGEVLRMWRDAFEAAAREADAIAEEEAITAMGEADGIPLGSLFVPDGAGQRIAIRADYAPGSDAWDLDSLKGWLAEDTVAELGLGGESDRPVLTVQETVSVVRDALDRLTALGRFSPGAAAIKALRTKLAERGRDRDAAVLGQLRSTGDRKYRGVKITREEAK